MSAVSLCFSPLAVPSFCWSVCLLALCRQRVLFLSPGSLFVLFLPLGSHPCFCPMAGCLISAGRQSCLVSTHYHSVSLSCSYLLSLSVLFPSPGSQLSCFCPMAGSFMPVASLVLYPLTVTLSACLLSLSVFFLSIVSFLASGSLFCFYLLQVLCCCCSRAVYLVSPCCISPDVILCVVDWAQSTN